MQLKDFQKEFNPLLEKHLQDKITSLLPYCDDQILQDIISYLIPYQRGGKRLRPFLVKTLYDAFDGKGEDIMQLAMSYELLHLFALVHDDIMDQGDMRRGQPTFHKHIEKLYNSNSHVGIAQGILIGDRLLTRALQSFSLTSQNKTADKYFYELSHELIMGQMVDIHLSHSSPNATAAQIQKKDKLKSGYYSFKRPMVLGGILANCDKELSSQIEKLGDILGLTYQIRDDLLDITGTHGHNNKTRFSDLSEGNQTIILHEALQRISPTDKAMILSYRGKELSPEIIIKISAIIESSGAIEATKTQINDLLDQSQTLLDQLLDQDKKEHTALSEIIAYLRV